MPERLISPAEAARRLGVSIHALRLYERKGLIAPQRTAKGWRVYGSREISRLHQVLSLKSLGLPLSRIAELLAGHAVDLDSMLALQEQALGLRRAELDRAIASIRTARAKLAVNQALSLDDITNLAREAAMTIQYSDEAWDALFGPFLRRRLTPDQMDRLKRDRRARLSVLGLTEETFAEAWRSVVDDATKLMRRGDDSSAEAVDVLRRWMELTPVSTQGDDDLQSGSLLAIYDGLANPDVAAQSPIGEDLLGFVNVIGFKKELREHPFAADASPASGDHSASEAAVRRLVDQLARGEPTDLGASDPSAGKGLPPTMMEPLFHVLGPLKSVRYLWSDAEGDVHRVAFEHGALKCTIRQDAEGNLTYMTLVTGDRSPGISA